MTMCPTVLKLLHLLPECPYDQGFKSIQRININEIEQVACLDVKMQMYVNCNCQEGKTICKQTPLEKVS